jgi:hypothetical protein
MNLVLLMSYLSNNTAIICSLAHRPKCWTHDWSHDKVLGESEFFNVCNSKCVTN